ncbi:hypothetical protein RHSIM_Rhsim04G0186500 [Rhododendron simsii]|uniref:Non-haem dioxygenase N-terminal domain-containing protein n=1 Tax=Rhododendron simsii TaxID=118357 RepID=A0A834H1I6_RHOSS|nr:hypothetical protein RHSIM_Rhsim04G0186500 [Rhododendron simsii]
MVVTSNGEEIQEQTNPEYDRKSELKAFDDTKTGVKGLVDAGVTKIPRIFIHDKSKLNDISTTSSAASLFSVPIIDFEGVDQGSARRAGIIKEVRDACEKLGFFQVVNHGIAKYLMDDMIDGVRRFHEQDTEVKKGFYSRDVTRKFIYNSNFDLYTGPATNWRDTFACIMAPQPPDPQELPAVCRYDAHDVRTIIQISVAIHAFAILVLVAIHNEEHSCKGPNENQIKLHSDQVKADCYGKFQVGESDETACMPSNSDFHEWGQSNLMDTIPRAGSSSSQAFSSRSLHP